MTYNLIKFRGQREGISIYIRDGNFEDIVTELERKIKKSKQFFIGAKVIEIAGIDKKVLSKDEKEKIENIVTEKYHMIVDEVNARKKKEVKEIVEEDDMDLNLGYFDGIVEGKTKFVTSTIRSGQVVEFDGNVVIIGDVNPGGEISAKGNIIVLGTLRGLANAGSDGNEDAIVAAFRLNPSQLRIASLITRKPDEEDSHSPKSPEIARIYDKAIIIESYLTKK